MAQRDFGEDELKNVLSLYERNKAELIPILQETQAIFGYLPEQAIKLIAEFLQISVGEVYSVASFYNQFRLLPLGRNIVTVCRGTACHIRGAPAILEEVSKILGLKEGETSPDLEYTLDTVACMGCCALAPCLRVNSKVYGKLTIDKVREIFGASGEQGEHDE